MTSVKHGHRWPYLEGRLCRTTESQQCKKCGMTRRAELRPRYWSESTHRWMYNTKPGIWEIRPGPCPKGGKEHEARD